MSCDDISPPRAQGAGMHFFLTIAGLALLAHLFLGWAQSPWILAMDRAFFASAEALTRKSWAFDTMIVRMFVTNSAELS